MNNYPDDYTEFQRMREDYEDALSDRAEMYAHAESVNFLRAPTVAQVYDWLDMKDTPSLDDVIEFFISEHRAGNPRAGRMMCAMADKMYKWRKDDIFEELQG